MPSLRLKIAVYGALAAVLVAIFTLFVARQFTRKPAARAVTVPVYGQVPPFQLTNQLNEPISLADLRGHIWIADVIFTRCPATCLKMSSQMARLASKVPASAPVRFVSLTTDPTFDTPGVLAQYARRYQADPARWTFLTGPKDQVYPLAVEGLKLIVVDKSDQPLAPGEELFLHSVTFVLVDATGRIRRYYDSSEAGATEKILADIDNLLGNQ